MKLKLASIITISLYIIAIFVTVYISSTYTTFPVISFNDVSNDIGKLELHDYAESYEKKIPIRVMPSLGKQKIEKILNYQYAIVSIIVQPELFHYNFSVSTARCYADYHNYTYAIIAMNPNPKANNSELYDHEIAKKCSHTDIMFRRHCFFYEYLEKNKNTIKYAMFLDADTFVVNPYRKLDEYMPQGKEQIIFYERLMNHEIACGSFLVKNTKYGREFFKKFADYQYKMPKSMHGSDNAGIHALLLEEYADKNNTMKDEKEFCYTIWKRSVNFDDVFEFEACIRYVLANFSESHYNDDVFSFDEGKIKVVKKYSKRRWIRDGIFSGTNYCKNDFLFHGFKGDSMINKTITIEDIKYNSEDCKTMPIPYLWRVKKDKMVKCNVIEESIKGMIDSSRLAFWKNFDRSKYSSKFHVDKSLYII